MTNEIYETRFKNLSDMKDHIGKELGVSDWITITQDRIDTFANATEDHQWIHVDPERSAKESPYKTTIAHGFLVLSLASHFCYNTYKVDDVGMGVNYGLDKVRFPNATPVNAKLRGRVSLMNYSDIPGGAKYTVKVVFELEGQEKPACVAEFVALAYMK
ncbi:MAG: MaoC family dehydratase [Bacteroidetes bacterium]|jgi:acyl dehydratase|nr:MaoC family dehydratase [Bacteroidota bacterium]MDF1864504.1 MaoC family dehydratase [Saprospiraceae bacterium]